MSLAAIADRPPKKAAHVCENGHSYCVRVPPKSDPRWRFFARGEVKGPFDVLAVQVLAMRMRIAQRRDNGAGLDERINEVYEFFRNNTHITERDLRTVLGTLERTS